MNKILTLLPSIFLFIFQSCTSSEESKNNPHIANHSGEFIYRTHRESFFVPPTPYHHQREAYPWETTTSGNHPKITKEYFRCKGSHLNPVRAVQQKNEIVRYYDCGGSEKHSLILRDNKEFVYPILIDLMNFIQTKTHKRVVITCGHRCPDHNMYADPSKDNQYSKHMIGAEVSFYVQGLEEKPENVIKIIQDYYKENSLYKDLKDFEFKRWEKEATNVTTQPWYNKEIFIKLFKKNEGRDFDNRHPYPYISIQVRYDKETKEKVIYTWQKANLNFLRK